MHEQDDDYYEPQDYARRAQVETTPCKKQKAPVDPNPHNLKWYEHVAPPLLFCILLAGATVLPDYFRWKPNDVRYHLLAVIAIVPGFITLRMLVRQMLWDCR